MRGDRATAAARRSPASSASDDQPSPAVARRSPTPSAPDDQPSPADAPQSPASSAPDNQPSPFAPLDPHAEPDVAAQNEEPSAAEKAALNLDLVLDIPIRLSVELGRTELPVREVVNLNRGSIIELDRSPGAPLDVRVNGILIGRGEVVVINEERLGLRFVEVASQAERIKRVR